MTLKKSMRFIHFVVYSLLKVNFLSANWAQNISLPTFLSLPTHTKSTFTNFDYLPPTFTNFYHLPSIFINFYHFLITLLLLLPPFTTFHQLLLLSTNLYQLLYYFYHYLSTFTNFLSLLTNILPTLPSFMLAMLLLKIVAHKIYHHLL